MKLSRLMIILGVPTICASALVWTQAKDQSPAYPVNVWIGTSGAVFWPGNTFPGAALPQGRVRLSPDTLYGGGLHARLFNRRGTITSGYSYKRDRVVGFSHTRLSGAGVSEGALLRVSPMTDASAFERRAVSLQLRHENESADPGYYSVSFPAEGIRVELAASSRCGFHRYRRTDAGKKLRLLVDGTSHFFEKSSAGADSRITWDPSRLQFSGNTLIKDHLSSRYGGVRAHYYGRLSVRPQSVRTWNAKDWLSDGETTGDDIGLGMIFGDDIDEVGLTVCVSYVSESNALENFELEPTPMDFDSNRLRARWTWGEWLGRIDFQTTDPDLRTMLYTSLYHAFLMPTDITDERGQYMGFGGQVGVADGFKYHTDLSLWDTFRTTHPLFTLVAPELQRDSLHSMLQMAKVNGTLPRLVFGLGDSADMLGAPANIVFAESYLKGIRDFDAPEALRLMVAEARQGAALGPAGRELPCIRHGYCPTDLVKTSVSKTLEYSWADGATADLATALGEEEIATEFRERAQAFKQVWDSRSGFFRPKNSAGAFLPFTPEVISWLGRLGRNTSAYSEGSAWHWRFYVPHRPKDLIRLFGGQRKFVSVLEFALRSGAHKRNALFPNPHYWQGNEHNIHAPYLFNEACRPDLTQKWVRTLVKTQYKNTPDGLPGNDDAGTLSSWLVFSALGLYPQAGTDRYWLGSPAVDGAVLQLGGGRSLVIQAENQDANHIYVQSAWLNGVRLDHPWVTHSEITAQSVSQLRFVMGPKAAPAGGYREKAASECDD